MAMRFLHVADLHFGKSIYGASLLDNGDQAHWVDRFLELAADLKPDAVVIAGDVYDRSAPSGAAVQLLSHMLTELSRLGMPVLMVAGNHDSAQRLSFADALLARQGLHISSDLSRTGALRRVTLEDEHGPVDFWLMPYVFPALAEQALGVEGLRDYDAAVRALLAAQAIDFTRRNVLIAHQNVTRNGVESDRGGSESMVGGVGQVEYTAFDGFDYVALGHIHASCAVGRDAVYYAGSPMCYHFNETRQKEKGCALVTLGAKGSPAKRETLAIPPLHPMRELRGTCEAIRDAECANPRTGEYLRAVFTGRRPTPEETDFLRELFQSRGSLLLEVCVESAQDRSHHTAPSAQALESQPVEALFADFYASRTGAPPDSAVMDALTRAGEALRHAEDTAAPPSEKAIEGLLDAMMKWRDEA